jgi:hypothetical protein
VDHTIWDTETYQEVATFRGHWSLCVVVGLGFLGDGNTLKFKGATLASNAPSSSGSSTATGGGWGNMAV